jgi:hypothetical protein
VLIPDFVEQLDEADTTFGETASEQAVAGETGFGGIVDAVAFKGLFGFAADVHQFWSTGLQAERHFVALDASGDFGVSDGAE